MTEQPQAQAPEPAAEQAATAETVAVAREDSPSEDTGPGPDVAAGAGPAPAAPGMHPDAGIEEAPALAPRSASNESAVLAVTPQAGAARAHAYYGEIIRLAQLAQAELSKVVPQSILAQAKMEVEAGLKRLRGLL